VDLADPAVAIRGQLATAARDRFLVCEGELDNVIGLVHAEDLLARCMAGETVHDAALLRDMARPPLFVPETMAAFKLLEMFRRTRQHAAVVLDEYGGVAGVATLDDLLASLIGEVPSDAEGGALAITRQADGSWVIDASTPIEDVQNRLDLDLPDDQRDGFLTLGGFVMSRLGRVPRAGDAFDWAGRHVEVLDMQGRRIGMVRISAPPRGDAAAHATPD
jgi:putative hemolysin